MFDLDSILSNDGFEECGSAVGAAVAKFREESQEKLGKLLVGVLRACDEGLRVRKLRIRNAKQAVDNAVKDIKEVSRAIDYLKDTGNPLPFFKVTGDHYSGRNFCEELGVGCPDWSDPLWSVPKDWVQKSTA